MLFNSFVFLFAFLPITYLVFWALRTANRRYIWLTLTGYVFYGWWDPRFCLLIAFSTMVSFTAGLGFLKWQDPKRRRLCLVVPITLDLLLLGFFKYTNFLVEAGAGLLTALGIPAAPPHLNIILPVGISFYTFHTITYIVDSYRGTIQPTRNLFEFSSYVSLFSQLVAGPIVRFRQVSEDFDNLGHADRRRWMSLGASYFVTGLVEKVVIADTIASFVDPALAQYSRLSTTSAWLAMIGYSFQALFDFSGYSSMAMGLGFLFGIRIPINFNAPYKALDMADLWRRWHISLSSALRDYLYIPLGGSRYGEFNTYRNLMFTMLFCGLWHGAAWTYVIFGAYHGLVLSLHRKFGKRFWDPLPRRLRQLGTFALWTLGLVIFRSHGMPMAAAILKLMLVPTAGFSYDFMPIVLIALGIGAAWSMFGPSPHDLHRDFRWTPRRAVFVAGALAACVLLMIGHPYSPYIYFQF